MKRVKPGVAEHVSRMTAIFEASPEPVPSPTGISGVALLILAEGPRGDEGLGVKWSDLLPGLQTRCLDAVLGELLSTVNPAELSSLLSEVLM